MTRAVSRLSDPVACSRPAASRPTRMRAAYLGPNRDVAKVRGTPHNTGEVLRAALAHGAQPYHAIQWDAGAPPTGITLRA